MIMLSKMNHCLCKGNEFVDNIIYFAFIFINIELHPDTKFANRCAQRRIRGKITCNKNLCGVAYPSDFIPKIGANKPNKRVVLTLEMAQTSTITKTQTKVILDVRCFEFLLSMAIMLSIHALHLFKMLCWLLQGREFKSNVTIEFGLESKGPFE
jgi:hypothetical protein